MSFSISATKMYCKFKRRTVVHVQTADANVVRDRKSLDMYFRLCLTGECHTSENVRHIDAESSCVCVHDRLAVEFVYTANKIQRENHGLHW